MSDNLKSLEEGRSIQDWLNPVLHQMVAAQEAERTYDYVWGDSRIRITIEYTPYGPNVTVYSDPLPLP